ncbi:MAG: hypothetical protein U9Q12_02045, partial [Patescibacteria group bacterium]|nr:hypothetical protein [Patescibacteria group bacterium]
MFMIINDEPSPIKRLRVETQKMIRSSLHKTRSFAKKHTYFVLTGLMVVVAGSLYLVSTASSQEEKPVVDENAQRYNACVLSKDLVKEYSVDSSLIDVDDECVQLSYEGKIMESEQDVIAQEIAMILEGSPMEHMAEHIATKDQKVAALVVGIANIESRLGVHSPSKAGTDCYNYWGFKSSGARGQAMGYACFGSREEAVDAIAKRLEHFVYNTNRSTPATIVYPWKCGGSCATHSPESVSRWIGTVN